MTTTHRIFLFLLRVSLGWYMFFAGFEKVLNPDWTAKGFLLGAKTFPDFYAWFALPANTWWVDPLNAWGILLVGVALVLGIAVRPAASAGATLMALYYFPHNAFPIVPHGYIVEEHVIYGIAMLTLAFLPPKEHYGLGNGIRKTRLGKMPILRSLL